MRFDRTHKQTNRQTEITTLYIEIRRKDNIRKCKHKQTNRQTEITTLYIEIRRKDNIRKCKHKC